MGGKQENYKRNFVEQIQLDKVDSFTLKHKSKLLQIQTHLVFLPIKTHVCSTLAPLQPTWVQKENNWKNLKISKTHFHKFQMPLTWIWLKKNLLRKTFFVGKFAPPPSNWAQFGQFCPIADFQLATLFARTLPQHFFVLFQPGFGIGRWLMRTKQENRPISRGRHEQQWIRPSIETNLWENCPASQESWQWKSEINASLIIGWNNAELVNQSINIVSAEVKNCD